MNRLTRYRNHSTARLLSIVEVAMLATWSGGPCWADIAGPRGIYVLGGAQDNENTSRDERLDRIRDFEFVDGYTLRVLWEDVETGVGQYDFSVIDQAIGQLEQNTFATKLNLEVLLLATPQHVIDGASETWDHFAGGTMPVPWDPHALQSYAEFIAALANHSVFDMATGTQVPLANHSAVISLNASVPGISGIRDNIGPSGLTKLVDLSSYDRQIFVDSVVQAVAVNRNAFADNFGFIGYFNMTDRENADFGGETLNETLIQALLTEFNNPSQPHVGLFQELLSDVGPNPASSLGANLLAAKDDTYIMFQALASWLNPHTGSDKVTSMNPATGIELGFSNYGATFYELYIADIDGAQNGAVDALGNPLIEDLQAWHDYLQALAADFDLDGDLDGDDLAQWQTDFGQNGFSDADGDGNSDGADFLHWQSNFGHQTPATTTQSVAVPEPSTKLLIVIGVSIALRMQPVRKRKLGAD